MKDPGAWIEDGRLLACSYPRQDRALAALAERGVSLLVNLAERPHDPARLAHYGLRTVHLPVPDFTAPTPEQIDKGVGAILDALAAGQCVAVHCGAGLGRTGTLVACYLVHRGLDAAGAIAQVRERRPGSVETVGQRAAVIAYAQRAQQARPAPPPDSGSTA
jgi:atypical dual specificity phosphatase